MRGDRMRIWAVAGAAILILVVGVAAGTGPVVRSKPAPTVTLPTMPGPHSPSATRPRVSTPPGRPGSSISATASGRTADVLAAVLAALVAAAVLALAARAMLGAVGRASGETGSFDASDPVPGRPDEPVPGPVDGLLTGVADAETALDEENDPRQAVLACWLRLEEAAARTGTPRAPSETAGELTRRVVLSHPVDREALGLLYGLYRRARYALGPVPASAREQARGALARVRVGLAGTGPAGPADPRPATPAPATGPPEGAGP